MGVEICRLDFSNFCRKISRVAATPRSGAAFERYYMLPGADLTRERLVQGLGARIRVTCSTFALHADSRDQNDHNHGYVSTNWGKQASICTRRDLTEFILNKRVCDLTAQDQVPSFTWSRPVLDKTTGRRSRPVRVPWSRIKPWDLRRRRFSTTRRQSAVNPCSASVFVQFCSPREASACVGVQDSKMEYGISCLPPSCGGETRKWRNRERKQNFLYVCMYRAGGLPPSIFFAVFSSRF